jgi:hypothetical protein
MIMMSGRLAAIPDILADTVDIQTQIGTAGAGLTDLGGMSTGMKAEVQAECDDALTNYSGASGVPTADAVATLLSQLLLMQGTGFVTGTDSLEAIRNQGDVAWITATSVTVSDKTGFSLAANQSAVTIGTVTDVTNAVTTDAASRTASKADVSGLATPAQVNAEVVDVVNVDTLVAGVTIAEALRRIGARAAGKISGAGTGTETVTDWAASANTIVYTVDASGNISAVTFN